MAGLFTFRVFVTDLLKGSRQRNFIFLTWGFNQVHTSNKSTHYLLDYGHLHHLHYYSLFRYDLLLIVNRQLVIVFSRHSVTSHVSSNFIPHAVNFTLSLSQCASKSLFLLFACVLLKTLDSFISQSAVQRMYFSVWAVFISSVHMKIIKVLHFISLSLLIKSVFFLFV